LLIPAVLFFWTPFDDVVLCPFRWLTALPCPLCGITRGLCAAAKGDFGASISYHAAAPAVLALMVWSGVRSLATALRLSVRIPDPSPACAPLAAGILVYGLARMAWRA
jgi:hypothetical protein